MPKPSTPDLPDSPKYDTRQRFFFTNSPVRGDTVQLKTVLCDVFAQKQYPMALQKLLGEMLCAASLFASTLKFEGRLSIQMRGSGALSWAMAECDHTGQLRALARWQENNDWRQHWEQLSTANEAFAQLDDTSNSERGVLFINIEPKDGQKYQSVVERTSDNLAECLGHFQNQSAQIATQIQLTSNGNLAGGIMLQKLPENPNQTTDYFSQDESGGQENTDQDLWQRLSILTKTLSQEELLKLPAKELLYRLYHEEDVTLPEATVLNFGCTCSTERCLDALAQLGFTEVQDIYNSGDLVGDELVMDCQFCGTPYRINKRQAYGLFKLPN